MKKYQLIIVLIVIVGLVAGSMLYRNYERTKDYKTIIEAIQNSTLKESVLTPVLIENNAYSIKNAAHLKSVQNLFADISWSIGDAEEIQKKMLTSSDIVILELKQENSSINLVIINESEILLTVNQEAQKMYAMSVILNEDFSENLLDLFMTYGDA